MYQSLVIYVVISIISIISVDSIKPWNQCPFGIELTDNEWYSIDKREIYRMLLQHQVINIRNIYNITTKYIENDILPYFGKCVSTPCIEYIHKPLNTKPLGQQWHSDLGYTNLTTTTTLLYGVITPRGGDTMFISTSYAYDMLMQRSSSFRALMPYLRDTNIYYRRNAESKPTTSRSIIYTHPQIRDKKCIRVQDTTRMYCVDGVDRVDISDGVDISDISDRVDRVNCVNDSMSSIFLSNLFNAVKNTNMCRYEWSINGGDLLLFDNRCLIHKTESTHLTPERLLIRSILNGVPST